MRYFSFFRCFRKGRRSRSTRGLRSGWWRLAWGAACCCLAPVHAAERLVALGGDVTEIVYALGAGKRLVGVDTTSEYPAAAKHLPKVGYMRQLNAEGVLALHPDLVIANRDAGPPAVIRQLTSAGVKLALIDAPLSAAGVVAKIRCIGHWLGEDAAAQRLANAAARQWAQLAKHTAAMPTHPRIVFLLSINGGSPLIAGAGTAADEAIRLAGGSNPAERYQRYRPVSAEGLVRLAPQVLLLMRQHAGQANIDAIEAWPGVVQTPAGQARRIWLIDGEAMLGFGLRSPKQLASLQSRLSQLGRLDRP